MSTNIKLGGGHRVCNACGTYIQGSRECKCFLKKDKFISVKTGNGNYNFKVHTEDNGLWAECLELEGCNTQGGNFKELVKNINEVLYLYFDNE